MKQYHTKKDFLRDMQTYVLTLTGTVSVYVRIGSEKVHSENLR